MLIPESRSPLKKISMDFNDSQITQFSVFMEEPKKKEESMLRFKNNFEQILTGSFPKKTMNMTWTQRHFCLTQTRLIYYDSKKRQQLKGCFNFVSLADYDLRIEANYPIVTLVISIPLGKNVEQKQLIKLLIQERKTFHIWRDTLSKLFNKQKQNLKMSYPFIGLETLTHPRNRQNFWNKIIISQKQFYSYANHLDIILFRSKSEILPSFQRFLMRSHYDHVGIVVKDEIDRIFILQATQSRGVWINSWIQMLSFYRNIYEQIAYRKLILKPNHKINQTELEILLNKLIGKRYELSFKKLLYDTSSQKNDQEIKSHQEIKEKTYFCSELIADIYIKLGLIRNKKRNQFWPKDFQQCIHLQNQAHLSPIMQIQI